MTITYRVTNPATGELVSEHPGHSNEEINDAIERNRRVHLSWRFRSLQSRAEILHQVGDEFAANVNDLARLITVEMGKVLREARAEVEATANIYRYYATNADELLADDVIKPKTGGRAVVRKEPIGPLLGIMPWNFPYSQPARFAAPNLLVGNTILLKPAPQCPASAVAGAEVLHRAGVPADAYIALLADNDQIATVLADPRVAGVSLTGSERAGSAVAETAGRHLKKVVLELGGSDPFIVLDGNDLQAAVDAAVAGRMRNAGQACNAAKRIIVVKPVYDDFLQLFVDRMRSLRTGDPTDPDTDYGPLSSVQAAERLLDQIDDAARLGATLHTGGVRLDRPGAFVSAAVISDVTPAMRAWHEELFGPAAVVYRVADADAAVDLANCSMFGLGGVVFGTDQQQTEDVAQRLDTGMVWINQPQASLPELPFGGTKRSGIGRELGTYGVEEFVNKKLVYAPGLYPAC